MKIDTSPPAFPSSVDPQLHRMIEYGMSLRDYFAGQALSGSMFGDPPDLLAQRAYQVADQMLIARQSNGAPVEAHPATKETAAS